MSLFKKKNKAPSLFAQLENEFAIMRARNLQSFYFPILDDEKVQAQMWCNAYHVGMRPDHITDSKIYYKFQVDF